MNNRRRYPRIFASLPCVIETDGLAFHSKTVDFSLGGLRVALPSLSKVFLTTPIRSISIDGLPALRVKQRWTNQNHFGAEFTEPQYARPRMIALIDRLEQESLSKTGDAIGVPLRHSL